MSDLIFAPFDRDSCHRDFHTSIPHASTITDQSNNYHKHSKLISTMKNLKGTKTEQNLLSAFAGESMARNKYSYYASKAKKEGFVQIANIFEETAANEKEHAKMWFKLLHDGVPSTLARSLR